MSVSLLKKSLDLCSTEYSSVTDNNSSYIKSVKKEKKIKVSRGVSDVKKKNINSIEQVKKKLKKQKDTQDSNLRKLKLLRKPVVKEDLAKKILEYTRKGTFEKPKPEEETSAFTEEDFLRFEREYQPND